MRTRKPREPTLQTTLSWAEDVNELVQEALEALAREGLIADSGRRRWSDRTGRYEVVWVAAECAGKLH